jgi:hypothetical protein
VPEEEQLKQNRELHPWRDDEMFREIMGVMEKEEIPWCAKCADWHYPNEEHSDITVP